MSTVVIEYAYVVWSGYTDEFFPDGSALAAENYCRNPDPDYNWGVWCYTMDASVMFESCDVPACGKSTKFCGPHCYFHYVFKCIRVTSLCRLHLSQDRPTKHSLHVTLWRNQLGHFNADLKHIHFPRLSTPNFSNYILVAADLLFCTVDPTQTVCNRPGTINVSHDDDEVFKLKACTVI